MNKYRELTLSSCFSKLFCHVISCGFIREVESKYFINPGQIDFRQNRRTSDHIYSWMTIVDVLNSKSGGMPYQGKSTCIQ